MCSQQPDSSQKLVSIIIPVYNVASYIEECVSRVLNQTLTEGVECIIVDDCGQDESMNIVGGMIAEYRGNIKFRIIHHRQNRGLSAARNTGMDAATGEYIYFLDSDDMIEPGCIEQMVNAVKEYPDSQIVFAGATATAPNYEWLDYTHKQLPEYSNDSDWLQRSMLRRFDFGMTAWNKLISRSFILDNNLLFVEGLVHEDEAWNFDVSKHIQSAAFVNQNTYIYNVHDNSIVTTANDDIRWERLHALWNVMLARLNKERKQLYIKAVVNCILEKTSRNFLYKHRTALGMLFLKLSWKSRSLLSVLLFLQGLLTICLPSKYANRYIYSCVKI